MLAVMLSFVAVAWAQTGEPPNQTIAGIVTIAVMVAQWIGSFVAGKQWNATARKFLPLANFAVSVAAQLLAAFATGLGPTPTVAPALASTMVYAGFFGSFGKTLLDVVLNAVIQTLVVTGGHSAVKNTKQGIEMAAAQKAGKVH
jgi:hypothetical protein